MTVVTSFALPRHYTSRCHATRPTHYHRRAVHMRFDTQHVALRLWWMKRAGRASLSFTPLLMLSVSVLDSTLLRTQNSTAASSSFHANTRGCTRVDWGEYE